MGGWKTKIGALLLAFGQFLPDYLAVQFGLDPAMAKAIGHICDSLGAGFTTWGIGHKIEKAKYIPREIS